MSTPVAALIPNRTLLSMASGIKAGYHDDILNDLEEFIRLSNSHWRTLTGPSAAIANEAVGRLQRLMRDHMAKEANVVFELIGYIDQPGISSVYRCKSIIRPISIMRQEHAALVICIREVLDQSMASELPNPALSVIHRIRRRTDATVVEEETLFSLAIAREASAPAGDRSIPWESH